jgi:iron complex outermembrane receptor protein
MALLSALVLAITAGTSLRAQPAAPSANDDNSKADKEKPIVLSPFEVRGSNDSGYGVRTTTSASRLVQDYIDVPQTVNVITSQFITDFNIEDTRVLFQYVPNISESQGQYFVVRGIPTDGVYVDGVVTGNNRTVMPLQFYDRVEVVKGPSSAAFGLGEPAGLINYVSKTPSGGEKSTLTAGIGDYSNTFVNFDTEGHSAKYKNVTYRLVTFAQKGYQQVRSQGQHSGTGAHLALKDQIDETTDVQLLISYAHTKGMAVTDVAGFFKSQTGIDLLALYGLPKLPTVVGKNVDLIPRGWGNYVDATNFRINLVATKQLFDGHVSVRNQALYENATEPDRFWGAVDNIFNPSPGVYTTGIDRYHYRSKSNSGPPPGKTRPTARRI